MRSRITHASAAPTRTVIRGGASPFSREPLLEAGQLISSPETKLQYKIERLLGQGGFGQVYLARRSGRSATVPTVVCVKVSGRIDGWLREAYFGQLLDAHPRAIRVFDAFPLMRAGGRVLYCLTLEYARHGDLSLYFRRGGAGWTETGVRREIAGILEVLGKLHRGQLLHRDLTPLNVFVCDGRKLKLGDFGIVRQQSDDRGITAHTMNRMTAPSDILAGAAPKWQARDDVYQVGQLLAMLVKGDARARISTHGVRALPCTDHLKEIVHRCIGERRKRYESADELIAALRKPPASLKAGVLQHAQRRGRPSRSPASCRAAAAAKAMAYATQSAPAPSVLTRMPVGAGTSVVVRGCPNPQQKIGRDAGLKLMEIKRLREKGQRITLLNVAQFWRA